MTGRATDASPLDVALALAAVLGLVGGSYFPAVWAGWCVSSPCGLGWPLGAALLLIAIVGLAAAAALRAGLLPWMLGGAAFGAALAVLNLLPPFARDELTHHLAIPDLYVAYGRAVAFPFAEQSYFPMQLTVLYTPLLAQGWEILPKQLHLLYGLGSVAVLFLYMLPRVAPAIAAFAALLLLTTPTFATLASSAYVDLGLFFFGAVSLVALLRWSESGSTHLLAIAGFAAGCAGAMKYNGYLTIAISLAGCVVLSPRRDARSLAQSVLLFGLLAALPLLPWMGRNWLETGNPFFPLMRGSLGGPPRPDVSSIDIFTRRRFLYGESWLEIATTPLRAFVVGRHGDPARFDGAFNPLFLLGFLAIFSGRTTERKRFLWLLALLTLFFVFLLATFRSRYAIAALAPLTILAAYAMGDIRRRLPRARTLLPALGVAALGFNAWHFADYWNQISPMGYLTGRENRAQFITRFVPEYPLSEFATRTLPPEANVYLAFLGQRGYYWDRQYTYDYYYSGTSLRDAVRDAETPEDVSAALRHRGISHLAVSAPLLARFLREDLTRDEMRRWKRFASQHLRLIRTHGAFGLYEII